MRRVSVMVCVAVVLCMAASVCYAGEGTALLTGNKNSIGQSAKGFTSVQNSFSLSSNEITATGGYYNAGFSLEQFIKPFHEAGLAATTPQQPFHQFLADAKAGKLSQAQIQDYADQLKANYDAYQGAFEAAVTAWAEPYRDAGLIWASE